MTDKQRAVWNNISKEEKSKYIKKHWENKTKHNKMEKDKIYCKIITQDDGIRASGFLPEVEVARYLQRYNRCKDYSNIRRYEACPGDTN